MAHNANNQNPRSGVEAAVLSRMSSAFAREDTGRYTLPQRVETRAATPSIAGGMLLQFC